MPSRPLPVLPGVYYGRVIGSFNALPSTNIFTFSTNTPPSTGTPDATAAQAVATALAAQWTVFTGAIMSSEYEATEAQVYPLNSPSLPAEIHAMTATGSLSGAITSATTAAVIRHVVHRRGKGSQSRTSISPVTAASITADGRSLTGSVAAAMTTAFTTFIASVLTDLNSGGMGVWSYGQLSKGTALAPAGAVYAITSSNTELALSTQRRRAQRP